MWRERRTRAKTSSSVPVSSTWQVEHAEQKILDIWLHLRSYMLLHLLSPTGRKSCQQASELVDSSIGEGWGARGEAHANTQATLCHNSHFLQVPIKEQMSQHTGQPLLIMRLCILYMNCTRMHTHTHTHTHTCTHTKVSEIKQAFLVLDHLSSLKKAVSLLCRVQKEVPPP